MLWGRRATAGPLAARRRTQGRRRRCTAPARRAPTQGGASYTTEQTTEHVTGNGNNGNGEGTAGTGTGTGTSGTKGELKKTTGGGQQRERQRDRERERGQRSGESAHPVVCPVVCDALPITRQDAPLTACTSRRTMATQVRRRIVTARGCRARRHPSPTPASASGAGHLGIAGRGRHAGGRKPEVRELGEQDSGWRGHGAGVARACPEIGPVGAGGPVRPVRPMRPVRPVAPGRPIGPVGAGGPVRPVRPMRPVRPVRPVAPGRPIGPV
eukprot:gene10742-biopygen6310